MKIVIYNSQTGFTKKYAKWIAESLGAELYDFKQAKGIDLSKYDAIVFGSWCMAGTIVKLDWFSNELKKLQNKKVAIFACGASPRENPDVEEFLTTKFTDEIYKGVGIFYCQGGINYDGMNVASRTGMKLFSKMLSNKKNPTEKEISMAEMVSHNYDITDKKYADDVVNWMNG